MRMRQTAGTDRIVRTLRLTILLGLLSSPHSPAAEICSYDSYQWNTINQRAENFTRVQKSYAELTPDEIDSRTGCSVCEQDQRLIHVAGVEPVRVCKNVAASYQAILDDALANGFEIRSLVGYRVGKTRGEADAAGRRTQFSNHSFGIALDINSEHNGLYTNCLTFGPHCRLLRGGPWRPRSDPASIMADSRLVREMRSMGFYWGGQIKGRQKDFMHFSPSGY